MKQMRYWLEAALVYILFAVFRALSPRKASALGGWIGRHIGAHLSASRKARRNVIASLGTGFEDTNRIVTGMWGNLGQVFAEYPHLQAIATHHCELVGGEHLGDLATTQRPAIFFAAHLANWEMSAPIMLHHQHIAVDLIYRPPNNPYVARILQTCRSMGGVLQTHPKSSTGMRQVMAALKAGRRIGILIDQKYNQGVAADFFGRPAMTSTAFIQLAKKFDCPLIPIQVERLDNARFRVSVHKPLDTTLDETTLLRQAHDILEGWIKAAPEHWLWLHRRWRDG